MSHSPTTHILCGFACAWTAAVSWTKLIPRIAADAQLSNSNFRLAAVAFCASEATLVCAWFAISYVGLAHARRGRRSAFVAFARRFGSPSVKRAVGLLAPGAAAKPKRPRRSAGEVFPRVSYFPVSKRPRRSAGEERGRARSGPLEARMVTALPGGCPWAMAARNLPGEASRSDIASHTQLWFEANRTTLSSPTFFAPAKS